MKIARFWVTYLFVQMTDSEEQDWASPGDYGWLHYFPAVAWNVTAKLRPVFAKLHGPIDIWNVWTLFWLFDPEADGSCVLYAIAMFINWARLCDEEASKVSEILTSAAASMRYIPLFAPHEMCLLKVVYLYTLRGAPG